MTADNPIIRPKRCTWQYDPKEFPALRGWQCIHASTFTEVPEHERCDLHPLVVVAGQS